MRYMVGFLKEDADKAGLVTNPALSATRNRSAEAGVTVRY
jgi:hypothetical protein